jgi:hypothetical protein
MEIIDKNLRDLLKLVEFHNTTEDFNECTVNENIILLVGLPESRINKYVKVMEENVIDTEDNLCNNSFLQSYNITDDTLSKLILYNLPAERNRDAELVQTDLKNDKQVKQVLGNAKKMKTVFFANFDNEILETNLTVNFDNQIRYLDQQVQALLGIVPNSRESVGMVVVAEYPTNSTLVETQTKWVNDILKKHSTHSGLIKNIKVKDPGVLSKLKLFDPENITNDTRSETELFLFNQTQFADSNEIGFDIQYLNQTLHTVKHLFNAFNSTVDVLAKQVFQLITPIYYADGRKDLQMLNQTYYKFYETMNNFDFSNQSTYFPINVAECLDEHNVTTTQKLQNQFNNSFPNYVEHRKIVAFFSKYNLQETELVTKLFEQSETQMTSNKKKEKMQIKYTNLESSLKTLKDKFELKTALMELDEIISTRIDEPSKNIHANVDGAVTIIEGEIEMTVDQSMKISHNIYEDTASEYKIHVTKLINTITNITHFLTISKLHRTIGTELFGPTEVFKRAIRNKLTRLGVEIEDAVKSSVALTVDRSLKTVIDEVLIVYKLRPDDYNTTEVLHRLDNLKRVMDTAKPMVNENFAIEEFTTWLNTSPIPTPKEYVAKFKEDKMIFDSIINATDVYIQKMTSIRISNTTTNRADNFDNLTFAFKHQNGVLEKMVNAHYDAFKTDVVLRTVEKVIENSAIIVDEAVKDLDDLAKKEFKIVVAADPDMSRKQLARGLLRLQDSRYGFEKFLKEVKKYFEIHYMVFPNSSLLILKEVNETFFDVEKRLDNRRINTEHQWGREFVKTKAFLDSSASTYPSFINTAVKWCLDKSQNLLRSASWLSFNKMFQNTETLSINSGHTTSNTTTSCYHQQTDINSSILLLDLILRKVTEAKPQPQFNSESRNFLSAQGYALNIVAECEEMLTELMGDNEVVYDFVSMQQQLMNRITKLEDMDGIEMIRQDALETIKSFFYSDQYVKPV